MESIDTALISAGIGAVVTLTAVFFGGVLNRMDRRHAEVVARSEESARWGRDQRLRAIETYLLSYQRVRNGLRFLTKSEAGSIAATESLMAVRREAELFNAAVTSLRIFGGQPLIDTAAALDQVVDDYLATLLPDVPRPSRQNQTEIYQQFRRDAREALESFVDAARHDFDLGPLPTARRSPAGVRSNQPTER